MQNIRKFILVLVACAIAFAANAQVKTVTGKVSGSDGEILAGATLVTASGSYALTDLDGSFSVSAKDGEAVVVSYLGYDDYTFNAAGQQNLVVVLPMSANTVLDEAVAIGYGKTTKKEVTGSVVSL